MTTIYDIYLFINFACDKDRNGFLTAPEVSRALDIAQNQVFISYLGKRQLGNELAKVALKPFYRSSSVVSDAAGKALYPERWAETQSVSKTINGVFTPVVQCLHNELGYALNSKMMPVAEYPRWVEEEDGMTLYPNEVQTVSWHYLARPNTPVIGFTSGSNFIEYDPSASVQLDFDPQYWNEIITIAFGVIGVNLSNQEVSGLTEMYALNKDVGNAGN